MSPSELDRTLEALADPHRRRVVDMLRTRPHRAGELARAANVSFSRMSRHLKVLRQTGLVIEQRDELDSRARVYRLHPPALGRLKAWLNETDALWARQLSAFRAHVRKARR